MSKHDSENKAGKLNNSNTKLQLENSDLQVLFWGRRSKETEL